MAMKNVTDFLNKNPKTGIGGRRVRRMNLARNKTMRKSTLPKILYKQTKHRVPKEVTMMKEDTIDKDVPLSENPK